MSASAVAHQKADCLTAANLSRSASGRGGPLCIESKYLNNDTIRSAWAGATATELALATQRPGQLTLRVVGHVLACTAQRIEVQPTSPVGVRRRQGKCRAMTVRSSSGKDVRRDLRWYSFPGRLEFVENAPRIPCVARIATRQGGISGATRPAGRGYRADGGAAGGLNGGTQFEAPPAELFWPDVVRRGHSGFAYVPPKGREALTPFCGRLARCQQRIIGYITRAIGDLDCRRDQDAIARQYRSGP
jgi:hypothetical protein